MGLLGYHARDFMQRMNPVPALDSAFQHFLLLLGERAKLFPRMYFLELESRGVTLSLHLAAMRQATIVPATCYLSLCTDSDRVHMQESSPNRDCLVSELCRVLSQCHYTDQNC